MGVDILRERLRLGEERLGIDRIASSRGFECACNARRADQRRRAAQRQNETEISHDQSPRIPRSIESSLQAWIVNAKAGRWQTRRSPLLFRMRQTVFLTCATRLSSTLRKRRRNSMRFGDHSGAGGQLLPIEKVACGGPGPRCHGDVLGSAALMAAGVLLAAAVIGTAPSGISRLFGNLVSRLQS